MNIFGEKANTLAKLDKLSAVPKYTYHLWKNGIYTNTEQLDDDLFNFYAQDVKGIDTIDELVASAYENSVDKVELTYDEFIAKIQDGYKLNEGEWE